MSGDPILPQSDPAYNGQPSAQLATDPNTSNNRISNIVSIVTAVLVFIVALGSFALSYSTLQEMANRNGVTDWLSYIWPLLIDFSLIVFSLSVVNAYLQSESTWKQWALVGMYTVATIGFNVAHAPRHLEAQIVATIAPVSLFFSFEILMSQLKNAVKRFGLIQNINQLRQELINLQAQHDGFKSVKPAEISPNDTSPKPDIGKANKAKQAQIAERREQVRDLSTKGKSQSAIAAELGVSIATIKRDTKALNGRVSI